MNATLNIPGRDARDRLARMLGLGIPHPLRDLELRCPVMVSLGVRAEIQIVGAQAGVTYKLCDDEGNLLVDFKKFAGLPQLTVTVPENGDQPRTVATLLAPPAEVDTSYLILASRDAEDALLETYLNRAISVQVGISTVLPVRFEPTPGTLAEGVMITIPYGERVQVAVDLTQEGISYVLVNQERPAKPISAPVPGDLNTIHLQSNEGFEEDVTLLVRAYRTNTPGTFAWLETALRVVVRPDGAVPVTADPLIVPYLGKPRLQVTEPQATASYTLYQYTLVIPDFVTAGSPGAVVIPTEAERSVAVRVPPRSSESGEWPPFVPVADFSLQDGKYQIESAPLREDTLFAVRATKPENHETLFVSATPTVWVRPDPGPAVTMLGSPIEAGAEGFVVVLGTQPGVRYQLRRVSDGVDVNPPGFHYEDRAIESARLGVDLVIEGPADERLLLPTGPLIQTTEFLVIATKTRTGLTAELKARVVIEVANPLVPAPSPTPEVAPAPVRAARAIRSSKAVDPLSAPDREQSFLPASKTRPRSLKHAIPATSFAAPAAIGKEKPPKPSGAPRSRLGVTAVKSLPSAAAPAASTSKPAERKLRAESKPKTPADQPRLVTSTKVPQTAPAAKVQRPAPAAKRPRSTRGAPAQEKSRVRPRAPRPSSVRKAARTSLSSQAKAKPTKPPPAPPKASKASVRREKAKVKPDPQLPVRGKTPPEAPHPKASSPARIAKRTPPEPKEGASKGKVPARIVPTPAKPATPRSKPSGRKPRDPS